jgi:hypothetical protein
MTREEQLAELMFLLGRLAAPVLNYCETGPYSSERGRELRAQFMTERGQFLSAVHRYGEGYQTEVSEINVALGEMIKNALVHMTHEDDPEKEAGITRIFVESSLKHIQRKLLKIPRRPFSGVVEAGSPFQFYVWLRSVCETALARVVLIDPYPSADLLARYASAIPLAVAITVVTTKRPGPDWDEFRAASELFLKERGQMYQIRIHGALHDRFVLADGVAYQIGASIKDAGVRTATTVTPGASRELIEEYLAASQPLE